MQGTFGCDTFAFLPISDCEQSSDADGPDLVSVRLMDEVDSPRTVGPSAKELNPHKADHMWWSAKQTHLPYKLITNSLHSQYLLAIVENLNLTRVGSVQSAW